MSKNSKLIYFFISFLFFTFFDKHISEFIIINGHKLPENPIFNLVYIKNTGAAFNMFDGFKIFLILFALFATVSIIVYLVKHIKNASGFVLFFTSLLCAGIFTNMFERLTLGYVRDYIHLTFIDFPVFNLSDIFINIGVFGLIFIILKRSYIKKKNN